MKRFTVENRYFLINAFFLALMQSANFLLPLLTVPFLVRVLGVELFGLLAFVTALMYYFVVLADYGFNLTATRDIAVNRSDLSKVSQIYSCVMVIKLSLLLMSFMLVCVLVTLVESFSKNWLLYGASFLVVVGQSLFPTWFFQGMERMKYVTLLSVLAKVFFTTGIFVMVSGPEDYLWVPLLTATGFFLSALFAFYLIHQQYAVVFQWPTLAMLRTCLIEGWYVFLSQLKITLFSSTNIVLLGLMTNTLAVGYYVAAEKIIRALALAQTPITGALFPLIAKKMSDDKVAAINKLKLIAYCGSVIYSVILVTVFVFAEPLIHLLYTDAMDASVWVLKVMLVIPLLIFLNNIFGTQILLNTGREKAFFYVLLCGALLSLLLCSGLTYLFSYQGTTVTLLIVEVFVVVAFFILVRKSWFDSFC